MKTAAYKNAPQGKTTAHTGQVATVRRRARASTDTHERQARAAAARILSGDTDVARWLTSAPPAARVSLPYHMDQGEALPASLRDRLETGFNADLGAVRLHFDDVSAAAVEGEGARALTSGCDIFFAVGEYQPASADGLTLIAHEVAHVLQQTGEPADDGRLFATAHYGSAAAQHEDPPEPPKELSVDFGFYVEAFTGLAKADEEPQDTLDSLSTVFSNFKTALDAEGATALSPSTGKLAAVVKFEQTVIDGTYDKSKVGSLFTRMALYDMLKILERFEGAKHLLEDDPTLPTTGIWRSFVRWLSKTAGENWFVEIFPQIGEIDSIFPAYAASAVWRYLVYPNENFWGSPKYYELSKTWDARLAKEVEGKDATKRTGLIENERVFGAYHYLGVINERLINRISLLDQRYNTYGPAQRRILVASTIVNSMDLWKASDLVADQRMAEPIRVVAQKALDYWRAVQDVASAVLNITKILAEPAQEKKPAEEAANPTTTPAAPPPEPKIPEIPQAVLDNETYQKFKTDVSVGVMNVLGAGTAGSTAPVLLGAAEYKTAVGDLRAALKSHRKALSDYVNQTFKERTEASGEKYDVAVWFGVSQYMIDLLEMALQEYDAAREATLDETYGGLPDVRLRSRYWLALEAARFAKLADDKTMADAAKSIISGKDLGYSYFSFVGEWERDTSDPAKLADDFDDSLAVGGFGGTIFHLRHLYTLMRNQAIVFSLGNLLDTYKDDFSLKNYGLIAAAQDAARQSVPYPTRWIATKAFVQWNENDVDTYPSLRSLFIVHPRFAELIDNEANVDRVPLISDRRLRNPAPHVWMLPDLNLLRAYLYGIPALRHLLEDRVGTDPTVEQVVAALNEIIIEARQALKKRLEKQEKDEVASESDIEKELDAILGAIGGEMASDRYVTGLDKASLYQLSTTRDRRIIEKNAGELLDQYAKDSSVTNFSVPTRAISLIEQFSHNILPDTELHRASQMALLMLSLAPKLKAAFASEGWFGRTEKRYDIITGLYEFVADAINVAEGAWTAPGSTPPTNPDGTPRQETEQEKQKRVTAQLQDYLAQDEPTVATLLGNTQLLIDLLKAWGAAIVEMQKQTGLRALTDPQTVRRVDSDRDLLLTDENMNPFEYEGVSYLLNKVETPFIFHPHYGIRGTGSYVPSILTTPDGTDIERKSSIVLIRYYLNGGPQELTITADMADEEKLEALSTAVTMKLIAKSLERHAAAIEAAVQAGIDIATMVVPGLNVAVLLADLAMFMATDMPTIKTDLIEAPMKIIEAISEFISPDMRDAMIERLWTYLLFEGDLPFAERFMMVAPKEEKGAPKKTGKFAKIAAFAKSAGLRLLRAFLVLRTRIQAGMVRAARFVDRHPLLQRLLRALPQIIDYGKMIYDELSGRELLGDLVNGDIRSAINKQMGDAVKQLVDMLNGMEVPKEILPLDLIVDAVLERFLRSLKTKGEIVNVVLGATGLRQKVSEKIAEVLISNGIDPNKPWQEYVQVHLEAMLTDARQHVLAGLDTLLKDYAGGLFQLEIGALDPIKLEKDETKHEVEALMLPRRPRHEDDEDDETSPEQEKDLPGANAPPRIDPSLGKPLSPSTREHYEKLFGHNLTHVRVHSGRQAARLTRFYGAAALTSGSHIFLSDETPPTSPATDPVFRHELAHVLQQTGARPLQFEQDPQPRLGDAGRGLRVDPRREAAAQHMARAAVRRGKDPVRVEEANPFDGLLPALSDTIKRRLLEYLTSDTLSKTFVHQIDTFATSGVKIKDEQQLQFNAAMNEADGIWKDVQKLLRRNPSGGGRKNPKPFNQPAAIESVKTYFQGDTFKLERDIEIRALTFYSFYERGGKIKLAYSRFRENLESYISAKTGVDIQIHFGKAPTGKPPPVTSVNVDNINLGDVNANTKMYTQMRDETNTYMAKPTTGLGAPFDAAQWQKIRDNLVGGTTDADPWSDSGYHLSHAFINEMRQLLEASDAGTASTWQNYVDPTAISDPQFGGLRVATHGQLTGTAPADLKDPKMPELARAGRQSHHVPQFLLVEYFENDNKTNVARDTATGLVYPPGFEVDGDHATGFVSSGTRLNFKTLDPKPSERGTGLPAVSLAAKTHQKGQLHINAAATWGDYRDPHPSIEVKGDGTQGTTINNVFYGLLHSEAGITGDDTDMLKKMNADKLTYAPKVLTAMRKTYKWMYSGMKQALQATLTRSVDHEEHWEATMYRIFARNNLSAIVPGSNPPELKPEYTPHNSGLTGVITAVEKKNREVMHDWWTD